tara:strand:+ start:1225 stop:1530 length:306 start_codon:yes stop_codon:yes gene_type:complete
MMSKLLTMVLIVVFFLMIVLPFYTEAIFLNLFFSYIISFLWFLMLGIIGIKTGITFFSLCLYLTILFIYQSFGLDWNVIIGSMIGVLSAITLYYLRGMNLE